MYRYQALAYTFQVMHKSAEYIPNTPLSSTESEATGTLISPNCPFPIAIPNLQSHESDVSFGLIVKKPSKDSINSHDHEINGISI